MNRRIPIGYWDRTCRRPLFYPGDAHLILIAPSGAGKGRDLLIPALLRYEGSTIVIDPKGQLAAVCGPYLVKRGNRVFALNPFRILRKQLRRLIHAGFNPLAALDPKSPSFAADCDSLAEAICFHDGTGENASYFTDSARQLISGVIMMLAAYGSLENRNLVNLYNIISGPNFYKFAVDACLTGNALIAGRLSKFIVPKADENKELTGIVNTARTQINFIGNLAIMDSLAAKGTPELRFSSLRHRATTVFVILPTRYLATSSKWFRLVIAAAVADLLQEDRGSFPVLAILDEFAQLGHMQIMSDIMGIGRGYGLQLWPVLQDLNQLEELYPRSWQTFLSNAGAQIFFSPRDLNTARHVSDKCGVMGVKTKNRSVSEQAWSETGGASIGISTGYGQEALPWLRPHQVAEMNGDEMLVFAEGIKGVIRAGRKPYWKMPECRGKFAPDPYHVK